MFLAKKGTLLEEIMLLYKNGGWMAEFRAHYGGHCKPFGRALFP